MSYIGIVQNGVVKLPPDAKLREGDQVRVSSVAQEVRPLNERTRRLLEIAARMPPMPPDFAAQHDHYIHGTPKR